MGEKNLMHVKLEFVEAIDNKKEVLALELNILKLLNTIRKYHELRLMEFANKKKINSKLKKLISNINKIKRFIPSVQVPKKYQKTIKQNKMQVYEKPIKTIRRKSDVEEQLQDIQRRLKDLDEKF